LDKGTVQPQSWAKAAPAPKLIATQNPAARPKPRARTFFKPATKDDMEPALLRSTLSLFQPIATTASFTTHHCRRHLLSRRPGKEIVGQARCLTINNGQQQQ